MPPSQTKSSAAMAGKALLTGNRVALTLAGEEDMFDLLDFHRRNADFFRPWLPTVPPDFLTLEHWDRWTRAAGLMAAQDQGLWLVARAGRKAGVDAGRLVGQVNLSSIVRGPLQTASLGFQIDRELTGRGLMTEAVGLVVEHAFRSMKLHRVTAHHRLENEPSARLLARLGFEREGVARESVFVDGAWRDQVVTARLASSPPAKPGLKQGERRRGSD